MDYKAEKQALIGNLKLLGYLKSKRLERALEKIERHNFVPKQLKNLAYKDIPLSIGFDQTISQPATVVIMTEALDVKIGNKILEIGTGSGWQAAILSKLVGKKGMVYTIERIEELAKENLRKAKIDNVKTFVGDGSAGLEKYKPYDRIIVTAACPDIPKPYLEQLKNRGRLVIPVGNQYIQTMLVLTKNGKEISRKELGSFVFVPLIGKHGFK
jgi:protein-L-isoaspartate(D-aspartate) O-methyltransferase